MAKRPTAAGRRPATSGPARTRPSPQQKLPRQPTRRRKTPAKAPNWNGRRLAYLALEVLSLTISAVLGSMLIMGTAAESFAGSSFIGNLLPFAAGVALCSLLAAMLLPAWLKWRKYLLDRWSGLPGLLTACLGLSLIWFVLHDGYQPVFTHFRNLVGGKQQAARNTLAHQVFAAYRRLNGRQMQKMIARAQAFEADIGDAARAFDVDALILLGVAATESSFMPRTSQDGGQGLFQITAVPKAIWRQAGNELGISQLDTANPRHNAFIAAATLRHYLAEMRQDLFLGLLAYNIGPRNGGLRFIMQQYGASDFVSMQPYLQQLPRDYPIRVLSYALAFKLWQQEGALPAYQENDNASRIQRVGIPGLSAYF